MVINIYIYGDHVGSNIDFLVGIDVVAYVNTKTNMEWMEAF